MRLTLGWPRGGSTGGPAGDGDELGRLHELGRLDAAATGACAAWRACSASVAGAYGRWTGAGAADRADAYARYCVALQREQRAAQRYEAALGRCLRARRRALTTR